MLCDIRKARKARKARKVSLDKRYQNTRLVYTTCTEYVILFPRLPEPKLDN